MTDVGDRLAMAALSSTGLSGEEVVPQDRETLNTVFETMAEWNKELKAIEQRSDGFKWPEP